MDEDPQHPTIQDMIQTTCKSCRLVNSTHPLMHSDSLKKKNNNKKSISSVWNIFNRMQIAQYFNAFNFNVNISFLVGGQE